ncbi:HEAT repeat domain-containing protein [Mastigocoleus testarum]|uniref:DUF1186 domain-containing protein n=1 Tax=Mastigocoleus testarum BC008 TaxID=371196 RepID=A0A0V7ZDW7_9CYAN|nr:hypothetical protein [Mastigocoleus testarum]KST62745.1 hypothetical protein BC008_38645 [Mastigocoleus testarum BC008]
MTSRTSYQTPVDKLLTFGNCYNYGNQWRDYIAELDLGSQHIPDLIQMAIDGEFYGVDSGDFKNWGPVHAWRALAQLGAEEAIEPLMQLFHQREDCDLVSEEMPKVFGKIGAMAIPYLQTYLADPSHGLFPRIAATNSLEEIANHHPIARSQSIGVLTQQLKLFNQNPTELNGFLVASLTHLQAKESALVIKSAFETVTNEGEIVPEDIAGTWDEIKQALGVTDDELKLLENVSSDDEDRVSISEPVLDPVSSVEEIIPEKFEKVEATTTIPDTDLVRSDDYSSPVVEITTEEVNLFLEITPEQLRSITLEEFPVQKIETVENLGSEDKQDSEEQVNEDFLVSGKEVVSSKLERVEEASIPEDIEVLVRSQQDLSSLLEITNDEITVEELNTLEAVVPENLVLDNVNSDSEPVSKKQNSEEQASLTNTRAIASDSNSSVQEIVSEEIEEIEATIKATDDTNVVRSQEDFSSPVEAAENEIAAEELNEIEEVISKDIRDVSEVTSEEKSSNEEELDTKQGNLPASDSGLSIPDVSLDNLEKVKDITKKSEKSQIKPEVLHPAEFKLAVEALSTEKKSIQGFGKVSGTEGKSKKKKKKKK